MDFSLKTYLLTAFLMITWTVFAGEPSADPTVLVPGGQVVQLGKRELKVKTPEGTLVEIELAGNGSFEEASGDNITNGDLLVPGGGLLSLADARAKVEKAGVSPIGEWSLEHTIMNGWIYEFNGFEQGKKMEYEVNAESGKLLSRRIDD